MDVFLEQDTLKNFMICSRTRRTRNKKQGLGEPASVAMHGSHPATVEQQPITVDDPHTVQSSLEIRYRASLSHVHTNLQCAELAQNF